MMVAASPTGKTLVWITEGELWVWHMNHKEKRFITDDGNPATMLGGQRIQDAFDGCACESYYKSLRVYEGNY